MDWVPLILQAVIIGAMLIVGIVFWETGLTKPLATFLSPSALWAVRRYEEGQKRK